MNKIHMNTESGEIKTKIRILQLSILNLEKNIIFYNKTNDIKKVNELNIQKMNDQKQLKQYKLEFPEEFI